MGMGGASKYAILDTDFVSKANIIKAETHVLADEVLSFPEYTFFCHQKMKEELADHGTRSAQEWLDRMISQGKIICYSDNQIIQELEKLVEGYCFSYYRSFLKNGCDIFDVGFYSKYFFALDELLESDIHDSSVFLSLLQSCETMIGHQQSYGEIKAFVLSQTLKLLYDEDAYIFCSDDFGARQGFANGAHISCISILSVFLKLKMIGKTKAEVLPFFQSFVSWCMERDNPQTHVRVWEFTSGSDKRIRVPISSLIEDIYAGKYRARKDGDIQRVML